VAQVREEMQYSIEMARNNPDPEKQAEFRKIFGDRTPTPEEFVTKMTKKVSKRLKF
jgi:TPP-dependent pyruvate/acetoin dehydrogenase alpha subunit